MKYIKGFKVFNEAIIDFNGNQMNELIDNLKVNIGKGYSLSELNEITNSYGIESVNYNDFFKKLSIEDKKTAPPKGDPRAPIFGLINPENGIPMVVLQVPKLVPQLLPYLIHILTHENIHREQHKRSGLSKYILPNPNDRKSYFSDKNEIMAFSHSIVVMTMTQLKPSNIQQAMKLINKNPIYSDIFRVVDEDVLKRYHKYIYLYFEAEFNKN